MPLIPVLVAIIALGIFVATLRLGGTKTNAGRADARPAFESAA